MLRILIIYNLGILLNYKEIDSKTNESDYNLESFVNHGHDVRVQNIDQWTDKMIEDKIDEPFYRFSMFENYEVV